MLSRWFYSQTQKFIRKKEAPLFSLSIYLKQDHKVMFAVVLKNISENLQGFFTLSILLFTNKILRLAPINVTDDI
jgi:hypothetical protein